MHNHPGILSDHRHLPRVIAWEVTRQCHLSCAHCRAAAKSTPYEHELTTDECRKVIDSIASFSKPLIIFTGGEPMLREDIYELIAYASEKGCRPVLAPCGKYLTDESVARLQQVGCGGVSISLDAPNAENHDLQRGVSGAFASALAGIEALKRGGIPFQINTVVTRHNYLQLEEMVQLAESLGAHTLDFFFLVPTGRAIGLKDLELSPRAYEETLLWIFERNKTCSIRLKTTCAPHYARICAEQRSSDSSVQAGRPSHGGGGCMGGKGFVFISHLGILQPCGFLDLNCGNLRDVDFDFRKIYETSPQFLALRNPDQFSGKCGQCEYRHGCSGCRARAEEACGDWMGSEPRCLYVPKALKTQKTNI